LHVYIRVGTVRELTKEEKAEIKEGVLKTDEKAQKAYGKMQELSELIKSTRNKVSILFI